MFLARRLYPVDRFRDLRHEMDRLYREFQSGLGGLWPLDERAFPALNIWEDGQKVYAEAEVPGFGMNDLELSVTGNQLSVKGHREFQAREGATYHRRERGTTEFTRTVTLPVDVDPEHVEATLKDGVLTIAMPKAQSARARKIEVKTA